MTLRVHLGLQSPLISKSQVALANRKNWPSHRGLQMSLALVWSWKAAVYSISGNETFCSTKMIVSSSWRVLSIHLTTKTRMPDATLVALNGRKLVTCRTLTATSAVSLTAKNASQKHVCFSREAGLLLRSVRKAGAKSWETSSSQVKEVKSASFVTESSLSERWSKIPAIRSRRKTSRLKMPWNKWRSSRLISQI